MKPWIRLALFVFLNIIVSACTTLAVLLAWDRLRGPLPGNLIPAFSWEWFSRPAEQDGVLGTPALTPPTPRPTATPEYRVYTVKEGDTFESIAQAYQVPVDVLLAENGFSRETILGVGEVLRIPIPPQEPEPGEVVIDRVVGVGDLASERVVIRYTGEDELSLLGWRLQAPAGQEYRFPQLTLFKGGAVNVYSQSGSNTVVDLYWGLDSPVWVSGDTATLRDASAVLQAEYAVP